MLHSDAVEVRMKELLVSFDGLHYVYGGFHYDNLPDAMAYASLMRARPRQLHNGTSASDAVANAKRARAAVCRSDPA